MGIPKFARFLTTRYPLILKTVQDESDIPSIDNLYLDINGAIHNCSHNNSLVEMCSNRPEDEIFYNVFLYVDRMVHMVKPKKVLMISADGVAPRAKMNQQRTRRFRKTKMNQSDIDSMSRMGLDYKQMFNSDKISAGTEFMQKLSLAFKDFIEEKIKTDYQWMNLKVIFTGSEVPGEGEHKIIEYIRNWKNSAEYLPETSHCLYGPDADLIMLSLISHEPNFCILKEEYIRQKDKKEDSITRNKIKLNTKFEMIYISILREYLEMEFLEIKPKIKFEFNIERIIDDFIFFCFFIGNDFLPSLNTVEIDHGSLDNIFSYYKEALPTFDDYITFNGKIDFKKAEKIFYLLSTQELKSLRAMLRKVETQTREMDLEKNNLLKEKREVFKRKKMNQKKENLFLSMKQKEDFNEKVFKKEKIKSKILCIKKDYEEEVKKSNKNSCKFEDDFNFYLKSGQRKSSNLNEENISEEINNDFSNNTEGLSSSNSDIKNNSNTEKENEGKNFCFLFESDDDSKKNFNKKKNNYNTNRQNEILQSAVLYRNYINNEDYYSDFNINDIADNDVSDISENEIEQEKLSVNDKSKFDYEKIYEESQDLDNVFQKKLVEFYITDINKAKAFYYKEKVKIDLETNEGKEQIKHMFRKYFEGLQWVLYYYYRGIQTWRWYYPYHYPPMISDFVNIKDFMDYDIDEVFIKDKPYNPLESLMLILPITSKDLAPKCLWEIYEKFPHFFPDDFKIDFNGKKLPWESLVILPFIEDTEILKEVNKILNFYSDKNNLTEKDSLLFLNENEIKRNSHRKSYIYSIKDIEAKSLNITEFEIYENNEMDSKVFSGNYINKKIMPDTPTLKTIEYNFSSDEKKMFSFDKFKNKKVLLKKENIITIEPQIIDIKLVDIEKFLKNGIVFTDYPMKKEAYVKGIYFNNFYYYLDRNNNMNIDKNYKFPSVVKESITKKCHKKSIKINSNIFVDIISIKKIAKNTNGQIFKIYNEFNSTFTPFELTSLNSRNNDFLKIIENFENLKQKFSNINTQFDLKKPAICLCNPCWGNVVKIEKIINKNDPDYKILNEKNYTEYYDSKFNKDLQGNDWHVEIDKLYNGPLIEVFVDNSDNAIYGKEIKFAKMLINKTEETFISMEDLAKKFEISTWTLDLITSNLFILDCSINAKIDDRSKMDNLQTWNIGLCLKSENLYETIILPGYTRYLGKPNSVENHARFWEFSSSAVELISEFIENFKFVIESLERYRTIYPLNTKFFKVFELFSRELDVNKKLNEICNWKNLHPVNKANFTTTSSDFISKKDCRKIEDFIEKKIEIKEIENNNSSNRNQRKSFKIVLNPNYLYQENNNPWIPPFYNNEPVEFELGDRVINMKSSDVPFVPFGLCGIVTGMTDDFIEICFDKSFFGATTCNGRFSKKRGAYVKKENLLNLTKRNKEKYQSWNHESKLNYNESKISNYALPKDNNYLSKAQSDNFEKPKKKILLKNENNYFEKENPENNNNNKFDLSLNNNSNSDYSKSMGFIEEKGPMRNIDIGNLKETYNQTNQNEFKIKKIIRKENNNIDKFIKKSEDVLLTNGKISSEQNVNQSEYNEEKRLFVNENLLRNNVYYFKYSKDEKSSELNGNKNIIWKGFN